MSTKEEEEEGGELVFAGSASHSLTGRSSKSSMFDGVEERLILSFSRIKPFVGKKISRVFCGPLASHFLAVDTSGKAYTWGRNEHGQLGLGDDLMNRYNPVEISVSNVVSAALTDKHTILCDASGVGYGCGENVCGELGIGRKSTEVVTSFTKMKYSESKIVQVSAGKSFGCLINRMGEVYTFGTPERGHLGNGTEGKSLERAGKYTFDCKSSPELVEGLSGVKIRMISSGRDHTICADEEGKVYAWGFNGYGQLGIGNNKIQLSPVPVPFFHNTQKPKPANIPSFMWRPRPLMRVKYISCGSMCCNVIDKSQSALYFWGIRKVNNEAKLTPALVEGVQGWKIKNVASGPSSTMLSAEYACETSLITWGLSPTHGELGYGEGVQKSASAAKKVDSLDGAEIINVAMGLGNSLAIVRLNKKGQSLISKCNVLDFEEPKSGGRSAAQAKDSKKRKKSSGSGNKGTKKKKSE